jgi:hypothetical protein
VIKRKKRVLQTFVATLHEKIMEKNFKKGQLRALKRVKGNIGNF